MPVSHRPVALVTQLGGGGGIQEQPCQRIGHGGSLVGQHDPAPDEAFEPVDGDRRGHERPPHVQGLENFQASSSPGTQRGATATRARAK